MYFKRAFFPDLADYLAVSEHVPVCRPDPNDLEPLHPSWKPRKVLYSWCCSLISSNDHTDNHSQTSSVGKLLLSQIKWSYISRNYHLRFRQHYSGNNSVLVHPCSIVQCFFLIQKTQQARSKLGNQDDVYKKTFRLCDSVYSGLGNLTYPELLRTFQPFTQRRPSTTWWSSWLQKLPE